MALYEEFVANEFDTIKKEFSKLGKEVITCDDFGSFKAWQDWGRRVKYGSKGLTVIGKNIYAQLMFKNGKPMKDEKGDNVIRHMEKLYSLFHKDQTKVDELNQLKGGRSGQQISWHT